jgi:hypothetical protein
VGLESPPDFQIPSEDVAQTSVGSSSTSHFDEHLGDVSTLYPRNLEQAHHQVVVRGDSESQIEAAAIGKALTLDKKGRVRRRPALCE